MKKVNFWRFVLMSITALLACVLVGCGEDDPLTPPIPEEEETGEVVFTINTTTNGSGDDDNPGSGTGSGTGTPESPIVVEQGDTLNMTVSQKSSYKDPDGSVFTCEPKSSIALHTKADTLYVKDIQSLISVKDPNITTSSLGTNPVSQAIVQTFSIGGKEITFDLAYEIFSYVNSRNTKIEMPYVKVNNAKFGKSLPTEVKTRATASNLPSVTGIRIRPHATTRSTVITDSTAYDVSVNFNIDLESVNTSSTNTQNLSFEVNFLAIVETSHELPDPTMDFAYDLNILGGTNSKASPFELLPKQTLSLEWEQHALYTYFSTIDYEGKYVQKQPKATAKVYAKTDTLWLSDVSEIKKVSEQANTSTSGTYPKVTAIKQIFKVGEQSITTECTYEQFTGYTEDSISLDMPYLKLGAVSVSNVDVQEHKNVTISGKKANIFNVTVRLSQAVTGENTPSNISETVQYVVKYVVVQLIEEPKLVDVQYRKDFIIEEPHHNMPLATRYVVYRDRIYSNGETITDTFTSGLCAAMEGAMTIDNKGIYPIYDDGITSIRADTVAVTNPEATEFVDLGKHGESEDFPFGEKLETYELMGAGEYFNPENPKEGWYFRDVSKVYQRGTENPETYRRDLYSGMRFYDRFLYIDGQIINFWDKVMTHNVEYSSESKTLEDGTPAKVFTLKHTAKYLGMDFSITLHDVYVQKK